MSFSAAEDAQIEKFVLSQDRQKVLESLTPGTKLFHFLSLLHSLNASAENQGPLSEKDA